MYQTWTDYGYGCICPIPESKEILINFAKNHNLTDLAQWLEEDDDWINGALCDYEGNYGGYSKAASIIADAIQNEKNINLCSCDDFDGNDYILFTPSYPWTEVTEEEKAVKTKTDVVNLLTPYLEELYGDNIPDIDYQEVSNGG